MQMLTFAIHNHREPREPEGEALQDPSPKTEGKENSPVHQGAVRSFVARDKARAGEWVERTGNLVTWWNLEEWADRGVKKKDRRKRGWRRSTG